MNMNKKTENMVRKLLEECENKNINCYCIFTINKDVNAYHTGCEHITDEVILKLFNGLDDAFREKSTIAFISNENEPAEVK